MSELRKVYLHDGLGNPIGSLAGALNVHDADVHNIIINDRLHQHTATATTLAADAPAGSIQITLTSAAGFAVGDYLHISNATTLEIHHPRITVLVGTLATLDGPLDYSFLIGDSVLKTLVDMNVSGTLASPQSFKSMPRAGEIWHLLSILIEITHTTAGDNGLFGNLPALINGVVLRRYDGLTGTFSTLTNWKINGGIVTDTGNVAYAPRSGGGGAYGTNAYGDFKKNAGATIYLNGTNGDYFEMLVQDDLTSLSRFRVKLQGHTEGV